MAVVQATAFTRKTESKQKVGVAVKMIITVVLEEMPNNWCAYTPDLEDSIVATGETRDAVIQNFRDGMLDLFDYKRDVGEAVPEVTALEFRETRTVETLGMLAA